jgi:hypothetical protein
VMPVTAGCCRVPTCCHWLGIFVRNIRQDQQWASGVCSSYRQWPGYRYQQADGWSRIMVLPGGHSEQRRGVGLRLYEEGS